MYAFFVNSFGVGRFCGSFVTHKSTKSTMAGGNPFVVVPVVGGVVVVVEAGAAAGNLGGGSFTMRCRSSSIDIWVEP